MWMCVQLKADCYFFFFHFMSLINILQINHQANAI